MARAAASGYHRARSDLQCPFLQSAGIGSIFDLLRRGSKNATFASDLCPYGAFVTCQVSVNSKTAPMHLKYKVLLLAVLPLLASLLLITWAVNKEQISLAERRRLQVRTAFISAKEEELRHYVALAMSTISPLYNQGRDDEAIKQEVKQRLANLNYGPDGYFFVYTMDGKNLMHPRQPDLVGKNLIELHDSRGEPTIRMLLERARGGGGFVVYRWVKPSTQKETGKLGYVTQLERWGWMVGTGMYLDDVDAVILQLDQEMEKNAHNTLLWIAGVGAFGVALIFASMLLIGVSEYRASDAKLKLLARKVVSSQEDERAYLSRELHDGTGQTLIVIKLLVESAMDRLGEANESVRAPLLRALDRLKEALQEVRGMSHRLRPVMLDTLGLSAALQSLGEEICSEAGIQFNMSVFGVPPDLPDDVKTILFRITQEALTNAQKHANCQQIALQLWFDPRSLKLVIQDDGRGFDVESVREHPRRGIGLRNMRERIESIGGHLVVQSASGKTSISATLPGRALKVLKGRT
jgi:two-component system, NarL family, sensor kinase